MGQHAAEDATLTRLPALSSATCSQAWCRRRSPVGIPASESSGLLASGDVRRQADAEHGSQPLVTPAVENQTRWSTSMIRELTASNSFSRLPAPQPWLRPSRGTRRFLSTAARWLTCGLIDKRGAHEYRLVLQVVQPALAGFMDGSVSTLAPLFATALATRDSHTTFLVGLAAAVGAGI